MWHENVANFSYSATALTLKLIQLPIWPIMVGEINSRPKTMLLRYHLIGCLIFIATLSRLVRHVMLVRRLKEREIK